MDYYTPPSRRRLVSQSATLTICGICPAPTPLIARSPARKEWELATIELVRAVGLDLTTNGTKVQTGPGLEGFPPLSFLPVPPARSQPGDCCHSCHQKREPAGPVACHSGSLSITACTPSTCGRIRQYDRSGAGFCHLEEFAIAWLTRPDKLPLGPQSSGTHAAAWTSCPRSTSRAT